MVAPLNCIGSMGGASLGKLHSVELDFQYSSMGAANRLLMQFNLISEPIICSIPHESNGLIVFADTLA